MVVKEFYDSRSKQVLTNTCLLTTHITFLSFYGTYHVFFNTYLLLLCVIILLLLWDSCADKGHTKFSSPLSHCRTAELSILCNRHFSPTVRLSSTSIRFWLGRNMSMRILYLWNWKLEALYGKMNSVSTAFAEECSMPSSRRLWK